MRQAEIWRAYLSPTVGNEQSGLRPVVIISGNALNVNLNVVIVCPLTSSIKNYKGNVILEPNKTNGLSKASEIMNLHVRSVSKDRLVKKLGTITKSELEQTMKGLNEILTF